MNAPVLLLFAHPKRFPDDEELDPRSVMLDHLADDSFAVALPCTTPALIFALAPCDAGGGTVVEIALERPGEAALVIARRERYLPAQRSERRLVNERFQLRLDREGRHRFTLRVDGRELTHLDLEVRRPPE